ncbi:MAG: lysylphosphatidylglycerol synthase transmembrane domain-containing protein [Gemmatimonadota bacterium]
MKTLWKGALGTLLSAVLIWFTLRGVDPSQVWEEVRIANFWLLGAALSVALSGYAIRAIRWRVLLHPVDPDTAFSNRFRSLVIGFAVTNLIPARVGEFARAYTLGRLEPRVSVSAALGSLVVERMLDGLVLGGFLVLTVLSPGFPELAPGSGMTQVLQGALTLVGIVLLGLLVLLIAPLWVKRVVGWVGRFLPQSTARLLDDALAAFLGSLDVVRSPSLLFQGFAWTVGFWTWHGLSFYLGMLAFGIDVGLVAAFFTEAVVGFGVALPAAPGFFGTFHVSAQFALERVYGADPSSTLAFAYGYHLGGFIPVTLVGLWFIRSVGLSMGEMTRSEEAVEEAIERDLDSASGVPRPPAPASAALSEGAEGRGRGS